MAAMETLGSLSSERERRADEATRHVEARYKCAYIKDRVGEVTEGVITGITHFGLFVTLRELNVDGLAHVTSLGNDYYHLRDGGLRLVGERTGQSFCLGDEVKVRILKVAVDDAKIDLAIVADERAGAGRRVRDAGPRPNRVAR
jgi:ribonuclease R